MQLEPRIKENKPKALPDLTDCGTTSQALVCDGDTWAAQGAEKAGNRWTEISVFVWGQLPWNLDGPSQPERHEVNPAELVAGNGQREQLGGGPSAQEPT
ncbi:hypothetical protein D623_10030649 [Myotis brandtii]|uniref:Uncharacterized protein n=1 Tax=Myotis brandtii TaxID=109478 RepID=S7MQD0_MYOBR|nr:hypothetical protein D623_10030649 [Myotis brandtii]